MNSSHPSRGLTNTALAISLFYRTTEQSAVLNTHFQLSLRINSQKVHDQSLNDPVTVPNLSERLDHEPVPLFLAALVANYPAAQAPQEVK
jgi:hypothetical protein